MSGVPLSPTAVPQVVLPIDEVPAQAVETKPPQVLRFHLSERLLHWSIAVPFMTCFTSAAVLALFFGRDNPGIPRQVFAITHRVSGIALIVLPLLTAWRHQRDYRVHLDNIRQAWTWVLDDVKWLFLMGAAAISKRIQLPEQGKFNAAEKLNFMMVMCTYPLFILTGVQLLFPGIHFLGWVLHVVLALLAAPLMLGHIYMALINPGTRIGLTGMVTGYVDRRWAQHHYTRWYRTNFTSPPPPSSALSSADTSPATSEHGREAEPRSARAGTQLLHASAE